MAIDYATALLNFYGVLAASGDMGGGQSASQAVDIRYANGTAAGKADKLFHDQRTLVASANEDLDLQTLTDANGVALGLAEVVILLVQASASNAASIRVNHGAANPWVGFLSSSGATDEPQMDIAPGATMVLISSADGNYPVTAGSKVLNVANTSGASAATYTVTILGRSA